jgi:hypothetical protein
LKVTCPSLVISSRLSFHPEKLGLQSIQLFFDWGRQKKKPVFFISGDTITNL